MDYKEKLAMNVLKESKEWSIFIMPKYKLTLQTLRDEIWYIKADSEEEAFDIASETDPDESEFVGNDEWDIEIDHSLDEAEENNLKERKWNPDVQ